MPRIAIRQVVISPFFCCERGAMKATASHPGQGNCGPLFWPSVLAKRFAQPLLEALFASRSTAGEPR